MAGERGVIVLAYTKYGLVHLKAGCIGHDGLKAHTWYELDKNGEFVECEKEQIDE